MSLLFVHNHTDHGIACYDSDKGCYITRCGPYNGDGVLCIVCVSVWVCLCLFVCARVLAFNQKGDFFVSMDLYSIYFVILVVPQALMTIF